MKAACRAVPVQANNSIIANVVPLPKCASIRVYETLPTRKLAHHYSKQAPPYGAGRVAASRKTSAAFQLMATSLVE